MPLTVSTSLGYSPSSAMACLSACNTPKSPQPGHQSGSAWPLKSLTVKAGRSISVIMAVASLHQHLVDWYVLGCGPTQNLFDTRHDVVRHERFTVVLANVSLGYEARFRAQVARKLAAVVVLDD